MYVNFGIQRDWDTDKWYFMIYKGEAGGDIEYRSEPLFDEEQDANQAALKWIGEHRK